jgi:hypothetical protein
MSCNIGKDIGHGQTRTMVVALVVFVVVVKLTKSVDTDKANYLYKHYVSA